MYQVATQNWPLIFLDTILVFCCDIKSASSKITAGEVPSIPSITTLEVDWPQNVLNLAMETSGLVTDIRQLSICEEDLAPET